MSVEGLTKTAKRLRDQVNRRIGERDAIERKLEVEREKAEEFEARSKRLDEAIKVLQVASETRRQELKERVDSLVTRGLRAVFGTDGYEFSFNVTFAYGVFGVIPVLKTTFAGKPMETGILEGHGGGIADVVAFVLRVIVLSLARPKVAPVMILDEAFSHVSPEFLPGVATLLKELSRSAGIQFIMVTHKYELLDAADTIYQASLDDAGRTQLTLAHDLRDEIYHRRPERGEEGLDRSTLFDHEDLGKKEEGEVTYSEEPNAEAKRHRRRRPNK